MQQRTKEKPEAVRVEGSEKAGCIELVLTEEVKEVEVIQEDGSTTTCYDSNVYRLTYPYGADGAALAAAHQDIFLQLAETEEVEGQPLQNVDKLAELMIENKEMKETQDDLIVMITDIAGGVK